MRKGDITVAKNYLNEKEIGELNRIVSMFLDYAEDQVRHRKQVFMQNWREKLDQFLSFNERDVLPDAGRTTRPRADKLAHEEYDKFHQKRLEQADADAEADTMKALDDLARQRPKRTKSKGKKP